MKLRNNSRWKRAASMCLAFQMAVTTPAAGLTLPADTQPPKVNTGRYAAIINPSSGGGSLALFRGSSLDQAWNTVEEALVPGTTMAWDGGSGFKELQITPKAFMSASLSTGGVMGVRLREEAEGVKSWFLFEDEIICAGAGVKLQSTDSGKLVTVVDTIPVTADTKLALTNPGNGFRNVRNAIKKMACGRYFLTRQPRVSIPRETG